MQGGWGSQAVALVLEWVKPEALPRGWSQGQAALHGLHACLGSDSALYLPRRRRSLLRGGGMLGHAALGKPCGGRGACG